MHSVRHDIDRGGSSQGMNARGRSRIEFDDACASTESQNGDQNNVAMRRPYIHDVR